VTWLYLTCFHMQHLTTTFLFMIIHEDRTSENRPRQWQLTECQEALSERQFGKQTCDTYFVWSWRSHTKRWYRFLHWTLMIFSRIFPQTMKLNHSVLSGSDGGSIWRLPCSSVHPKIKCLKSLFGADIMASCFNI